MNTFSGNATRKKFITAANQPQIEGKLLKEDSLFFLKKGGRLEVPETYGAGSRNLQLEGDLLFLVEKGDQPVKLKVGHTRVIAQEANFNVAQRGAHVLLHVLRGEVLFETPTEGDMESRVVHAMEVANFHPQLGLSSKSSFSIRHFHQWQQSGVFNLNNHSMQDACAILARHFAVDFDLDPELAALNITTQIKAKDAQTAFKTLSEITNTQLNVEERTYHLNKSGR